MGLAGRAQVLRGALSLAPSVSQAGGLCWLAREAVRTGCLLGLALGHRLGSIWVFAQEQGEREIQTRSPGLIPRPYLPSARPCVCARAFWASVRPLSAHCLPWPALFFLRLCTDPILACLVHVPHIPHPGVQAFPFQRKQAAEEEAELSVAGCREPWRSLPGWRGAALWEGRPPWAEPG